MMFFGKKKAEGKAKGKAKSVDSGAYRRGRRPVRVRRGWVDWFALPWRRMAFAAALIATASAGMVWARGYVGSAERFRFDREALRITGFEYLEPLTLRAVFEQDFGMSLAALPIDERRRQLLDMPWVRRAVVARQWPNRLWVDIEERRPVAFVRASGGAGGARPLRLIDDEGRFLEPLAGLRWELPVVDGLNAEVPQQERARRLEVFAHMMAELDGEDPPLSERLSQINLGEPDDVVVMTRYEDDMIELHLGDKMFRERFETFDRYVEVWKRRFKNIASIDLRWEKQAVVEPVREQADAGR